MIVVELPVTRQCSPRLFEEFREWFHLLDRRRGITSSRFVRGANTDFKVITPHYIPEGDRGGFRVAFEDLAVSGQMLRPYSIRKELSFLFNRASRKERQDRNGSGAGEEEKRVRVREGVAELFRRAVDTIRDSLHGHCTPFGATQWLEKVYPDIPPPLERL